MLALLVAGALVLRIGWILRHGPGEITWDGAEYARIAQNVLAGAGYVGMRGHEMFVFPPLYPLTIAALLPFTHSAELAGTLVSLIAGVLLVVPLYALAADLYGPRAGIAAGALAAALPFTVQLSTVVLSDALFLTLAAGGLALLVRAARDRGWTEALGCGACFGAAYLTRPEGALLEAVAIVAVLAAAVLGRDGLRRGAASAAAVALPFLILAAPYIAFLSTNAGHLRIEGKSILNLDIGLRMSRGMSYADAADAIDASGRQVGPELADDYYFEPQGRKAPSLRTVVAFAAANTLRHVPEAVAVAKSRTIGGPLFLGLALLGLAAGPWSRRRGAGEAILVLYACAIVAALASVFHFWERYFTGFVPLVVWAAHGTDVAAAYLVRRLPRAPRGFIALPAAVVVVVLIGALFSTRTGFTDDAATLSERRAGGWLAVHAPPGARILSISDQVAYYADGLWSMLPVSPDDASALRYLEDVDPDYVVLDREYASERPYVERWLDHGIPAPQAREVHAIGAAGEPALAVYAWKARELSTSSRTRRDGGP